MSEHIAIWRIKWQGTFAVSPAIVFTSWRSSTYADVMFRRQRSKGSWDWMETKQPLCSFHSHGSFMLCIFLKRSKWQRERHRWHGEVSQQSSEKINSGTDSDTGKHLTSRLPAHSNHVLRRLSAHAYLQRGLSGALFSTSHSNQGFFLVITAVHAPASNLHSPLEYENRLLNPVNYVSVCDLYPRLPWPLSLKPYLCSAPSYLLHLAIWRYATLRTSLGCASGCHHMPQATSVCQMPRANWLKCAQILSGGKKKKPLKILLYRSNILQE